MGSTPFDTNNPGIGGMDEVTSAEEALIVAWEGGVLRLLETSAPTQISGYGLLYVKSSDSLLYFKDDSGTEYSLTAATTPTVITVADTTDATCWIAMFNDATGDLAPKTDGALTYNAATGALTAVSFVGNLTGNASGTAATVTSATQTSITTLANLVSIQGRTVTLADAGANAIFGWDDVAGAYENLTQAEARTVLGLGTAALVATDLSDLNEATIEAAIDTLANLTSIQGQTISISAPLTIPADPNADRLLFWDDSAGATAWLTPGSGLTITTTTITVDASSTTVSGIIEIAIASEVNTGTDATRAVSPDALAGSYAGTKVVECVVVDYTTNTATGDGKFYFTIPSTLNGMNLIAVHARVITAGTTNTTDIQIANVTQAADMLSTKITIDSAETGSDTAATAAVIDTGNDDVATNDLLRIDVDAVSTTPAKGLIVRLEFQLP